MKAKKCKFLTFFVLFFAVLDSYYFLHDRGMKNRMACVSAYSQELL